MRPFQRLPVDVLLEQTFLHHQPQIGPRATPRCISGFIDDMAQIIKTARPSRTTVIEPMLTRLAAFPRAGGKAEDFHLYITPLQRARENIRTDSSNGNRTPAHGSRVIQQQRHNGIAELGILLDLKAEGRCRACHDPCQTARVQRAFLQIKLPRAVLLGLKATLQLVCQTAYSAFERL